MPIYEYHCEKCGLDFDELQPILSEAKTVCPSCGKSKSVKRVFSKPNLRFIGSGFYENDYKKKK